MQLLSAHDLPPDPAVADESSQPPACGTKFAHRTLQTATQQIEAQWNAAIVALRQLRTLLADHPRLQHFIISSDLKEVSVRLTDRHDPRGYRYFLLTRGHPDGAYHARLACWLREPGQRDSGYTQPPLAMKDLMRRIIATLA